MQIERELVSFVLSGDQMNVESEFTECVESLKDISEREGLDAEYIIVVSYLDEFLKGQIRSQLSRYPVQIVVIGEGNSWDQAMFAGLSRANGDYSLVLGRSLKDVGNFLPSMLNVGKRNSVDVVGLRRNIEFYERLRNLPTALLFRLLRNRVQSPLSLQNCDELLVSRKALNWIIRDLSLAQSLIEMFLIPGLTFDFVTTDLNQTGYHLSSDTRSRLLTRHTQVPLSTLKACFSLTSLVMVGASVNAISVRTRGLNIFNQPDPQIPGWTTMVILISFGFSVTIYSLFILLRTILHLADQYSSKPSHVIKSVQRP